jgi:hypothetical protein
MAVRILYRVGWVWYEGPNRRTAQIFVSAPPAVCPLDVMEKAREMLNGWGYNLNPAEGSIVAVGTEESE